MPDVDHRIYLLAAAALVAISLHALLVQRHRLRRIMALNVLGSGVFLAYIALAARAAGPISDPVPQAMVLTGIVVSVCATGLALALADRVERAEAEEEAGGGEAVDGGAGPSAGGCARSDETSSL